MDLMTLRKEIESLGIPVPASTFLDDCAAMLTADPTKNVASLVGSATILFYMVERGKNPKVKDIWDALVYVTTCLSVGYGDIFAQTPAGKIIGSALMTVGPTMASKVLDGRQGPRPPDPVQEEILETLKKILKRLEDPAS